MQAVQHQELQVLWLAVWLAAFLGWVIQRSHFCTMGALSDWLWMRDTTRLKQWALALSLSVLGFSALHAAGFIHPFETIYAAANWPWLSYALGGAGVGVGMVLASGCPAKNLVRLGGGSLKALVVLIVMGVSAQATLRGLPGLLRATWLDPWVVAVPTGPFVGQLLAPWWGASPVQGMHAAAVLVGSALLAWSCGGRSGLRGWRLGAGVGLAAALLAVWWVSGVWGWLPEHPETLEPVYLASASRKAEGLSFTGPVAQWLDAFMYGAEGGKRVTLGMALCAGVPLGAAWAAWRAGQWRLEGFTQAADLLRHLVGAVLMGVGGVCAMGCTFGQGMTGLSTLNWGSLVAVSAMALAAVAALRVQWWWMQRHAD